MSRARKTPNQVRADRALAALSAYIHGPFDDCAVIDILTDLRHLCDATNIDMSNCDRIARNHYLEELKPLEQQT